MGIQVLTHPPGASPEMYALLSGEHESALSIQERLRSMDAWGQPHPELEPVNDFVRGTEVTAATGRSLGVIIELGDRLIASSWDAAHRRVGARFSLKRTQQLARNPQQSDLHWHITNPFFSKKLTGPVVAFNMLGDEEEYLYANGRLYSDGVARPLGPALRFTHREHEAFLAGVNVGEFGEDDVKPAVERGGFGRHVTINGRLWHSFKFSAVSKWEGLNTSVGVLSELAVSAERAGLTDLQTLRLLGKEGVEHLGLDIDTTAA